MKKHILLLCKLIAAIIMLQTLFFKFSGAQESIDLFTKVAGTSEAIVRIGTGVLELFAAIFLFTPKKTWIGALLTISLMLGAIFSHFTTIGIIHNDDGGLLFFMAFTTLLCGIILLFTHLDEIPFINK